MKPYTYVLVREDIALAQQMVQACHAAHHAGFSLGGPVDEASLIVCTVPDRAALVAAQARLARYGIRSNLFFEPSWEMGFSALGTEPITLRKQRFAMSKYPLFCAPGRPPSRALCEEEAVQG